MAWLGGFKGGLEDGPAVDIESFKQWLETQPKMAGLQLIALHNSAAPNIKQTDNTPGGYDQRQRNIAVGYQKQRWRGGPAWNVYPDGTIRTGTPWGKYGVHSPSWNDIGIGIEMMADFSPGHDDDDSGKGLLEKNTACAMIAAVLRHQGLPVSNATVKLHKEDPRTTHDCPGKDIEKADILARVQGYYDAMGTPGEHLPELDTSSGTPAKPVSATDYVATVNDLNVRDKGGMAGKIITKINKGQLVRVWSTAKNAATTWGHVTGTLDGGKTHFDGYVSMAYLALKPAPGQPVPPPVVVPNPSDNPHWALQILESQGFTDYRAAGIVGNLQRESYPDLRPWVSGDKMTNGRPDPNGQPTAFGIGQWRNDRKAALDVFAASRGKTWDDFETQVLFAANELVTSEKTSGALLNKAANVEEATAAMVSAERPRGWHWPADRTDMAAVLAAAKASDGWDARLRFAKALI